MNRNIRLCRRIRTAMHRNICYECHACFGKKNPDRVFYVIRCHKNDIGFFGLYNFIVFHLKRAEQLGAEPVIDLKYYPNDYIMEDENVGKINCWELYFKQATDISIDEVYHSKNVIMGSGESCWSFEETEQPEELLKSSIIVKKYCQPTEAVNKLVEKKLDELGMNGKRVLGVKCRGTDRSQTQSHMHSKVPDADQTIEIIKEKEREWSDGGFDYIFVATEDEQIYRQLKKEYGERMISNDTALIGDVNGKWLNEMFSSEKMKGTKYQKMVEYVVSIILLSKCDSLIAPLIGGTLGAMRMNGGKYKNVYLFHLGAWD